MMITIYGEKMSRIIYDTTSGLSVVTAAMLHTNRVLSSMSSEMVEISFVDEVDSSDILVGAYSNDRYPDYCVPREVSVTPPEQFVADLIDRPISIYDLIRVNDYVNDARNACSTNSLWLPQIEGENEDVDVSKVTADYGRYIRETRVVINRAINEKMVTDSRLGIAYKLFVINIPRELWDVTERLLTFNKGVNVVLYENVAGHGIYRVHARNETIKATIQLHAAKNRLGFEYSRVRPSDLIKAYRSPNINSMI
jgi:hypothetical protein